MTAKRPEQVELSPATICAAVCTCRGGFHDAPEEQLIELWNRLDPDTQTEYLARLEGKTNPAE